MFLKQVSRNQKSETFRSWNPNAAALLQPRKAQCPTCSSWDEPFCQAFAQGKKSNKKRHQNHKMMLQHLKPYSSPVHSKPYIRSGPLVSSLPNHSAVNVFDSQDRPTVATWPLVHKQVMRTLGLQARLVLILGNMMLHNQTAL